METLLSLAFDNLSSYDGPKIRKGLRQVEGLLAQICLSAPQRPRPGAGSGGDDAGRTLADLAVDPAFHQFFRLQEGFEWNVALRLVVSLDRLVAKGGDGQNDLVILSALDLLQGLLLLHPPSKALFSREQNMNLLLDLLEPTNCPAIQSATLLTLVVALIDAPRNTRTFEALDGLLMVTSLFRSRATPRDVKLKLVEFLYFYLMPEAPATPPLAAADADVAADDTASARPPPPPTLLAVPAQPLPRRNSNRGAGKPTPPAVPGGGGGGTWTLSTEEKQALLGRHISNAEDLVKDLRTSAPFGGVMC